MAFKIITDRYDGVIDIDYAIPNKRIREFTVNGETVYSEYKNIALEGWQEELRYYVKKYDLDTEFLECRSRQ